MNKNKSSSQTHSTNKLSSSTFPEKEQLLISDIRTRDAFIGIRDEIENTRKATIQERRRAKYLPKALDIVTGGLPSEDEIATKNSEDAWDKLKKQNAIENLLATAALRPMTGNPIRIIDVSSEGNPDAVEVTVITHEGMSPDIAEEIGRLARNSDKIS